MSAWEPIRLEPRLAEAIWGGRRLADEFGKALPVDRQIGESWEVFGLNPVLGGPWDGQSLDDVARQGGASVLGWRVIDDQDASEGFPLLIKFIDARLPLSVQVHPDDGYARAHEANRRGKTEAWYVVEADPDSALVYGLRDGVDAQRIARSVANGELERDLSYLRVRSGDAVFVPAGTVHAISAGILLYEVQQRSEITYRLYDWGRVGADGQPRALHVDKALAVLRFPQPPPRTAARLTIPTANGATTYLAACAYFALAALEGTIDGDCDGSTFVALSAVRGGARLSWDGGAATLGVGESIVLPAALGRYRVEVDDGARVLRSTVPDLQTEVVVPLLAVGYRAEEIALLGDVTG
ncbi:MAG: type I phosphomannose isomerase catalytic subunit [Chloroflexota bacterium]